MTDPQKKIQFVITIPERGYELMLLDAKRLGIKAKGRAALEDLLVLYAEEINNQPQIPPQLYKSYPAWFRGSRQ